MYFGEAKKGAEAKFSSVLNDKIYKNFEEFLDSF